MAALILLLCHSSYAVVSKVHVIPGIRRWYVLPEPELSPSMLWSTSGGTVSTVEVVHLSLVHPLCRGGCPVEAGVSPSGGCPVEAGVSPSGGCPVEAGMSPSGGCPVEAGMSPSGGCPVEAGVSPSGGCPVEAGVSPSGGCPVEAGVSPSGGCPVEAGMSPLWRSVRPPVEVPVERTDLHRGDVPTSKGGRTDLHRKTYQPGRTNLHKGT